MKFHASHRYARIAPRKVRYVMDLIRGRSVNEAAEILRNVQKRAAPMIKRVLESAIANAAHQGTNNVNALVIAEAKVDEGPMWKRYQAGPMGRAMRIRRRTAHINIVITEQSEQAVESK